MIYYNKDLSEIVEIVNNRPLEMSGFLRIAYSDTMV